MKLMDAVLGKQRGEQGQYVGGHTAASEAFDATNKAQTKEDHQKAAEAHRKAAEAFGLAGDHTSAEQHRIMARAHSQTVQTVVKACHSSGKTFLHRIMARAHSQKG